MIAIYIILGLTVYAVVGGCVSALAEYMGYSDPEIPGAIWPIAIWVLLANFVWDLVSSK